MTALPEYEILQEANLLLTRYPRHRFNRLARGEQGALVLGTLDGPIRCERTPKYQKEVGGCKAQGAGAGRSFSHQQTRECGAQESQKRSARAILVRQC